MAKPPLAYGNIEQSPVGVSPRENIPLHLGVPPHSQNSITVFNNLHAMHVDASTPEAEDYLTMATRREATTCPFWD